MKKRNFWKKIVFFVAIFVMAVTLTGCGGKETGKEVSKQEQGGTKEKNTNVKTDNEYCYQASFQELSVKSTDFKHMCESEGKIYMIGNYYEENEETGEYSTHYCLLEGELDGSGWKETELKLKKDEYIQLMAVDDKNQLLILTLIFSYNEETEERKEQYYIKKLEKDGNIEKDHKLQRNNKDANDFNFYLGGRGTMLARDGSIYAADYDNSVYYFDETGKQKKSFDMKASVENMIQTKDGSIYAYGDLGQDRKSALRKLDLEQQKFGEAIVMDASAIYNTNSYGGSSVYLQNDVGIYSIDASNGKTEMLFNWINQDIDGQQVRSYLPLEDGSILAVVSPFNREEGKSEIAVIKKVTSSEVKPKTILTLACTYLVGNLKEAVLDFNKTNETYRIEVQEYSSYEDGAARLNLDMVSGQVPDIISLYQLPANMYVKKGLLTDLYPLMEGDAEIKKEDFLDSVINTLEQDGKLYYLNSTFSLNVWSVGEKYWKEKEGWNFEEMQKLYNSKSKDQLFFYYIYREGILRDLILGQMDDLIDWKTGEVHMDTENFIHMLEFSKSFPSAEEADFSDIDMGKTVKKGNIMLMDSFIYNMSDIELQTEFYKKAGGFHIVSYPSEDRNNHISMNPVNPPMAITEQCKNKEGAWEFIRKSLTYDGMLSLAYSPEGYGSDGIPTRKDVFEKVLEYSMATEEYEDNGIKVVPIESNYSYNGYEVSIGPISEEEVNQIRNIVDRIGALNMEGDTMTEAITNIIEEETAAMYAEDKTAEQAAEIIQSRVKLLVSENS